ncbi:MAG TPA: amidohydrolase family protein [Acidimicrobiales bacterium]|nr:amidohydrolase family protein [Acidimicrobiales bacterium]
MSATVFTNANVITCDAQGTVGTALAIDEGRIAAVGDDASVRSRSSSGTETIDLHGATVLPGLIDTHPHLMHFGALAEPLVDIADARSHFDIVDRVAQRASEVPPGEWIMTTPGEIIKTCG